VLNPFHCRATRIEANDLVFFASLIVFWLFANILIVELRKAR